LNAEKAGRAAVRGPELRRCPAKAEDACRLRHAKEQNQADVVPAERRRHRDRVKALRLRSLNVTEAGANLASDLQSLVQRVVNMEQRKPRRNLPSKVRRRSQNVVARQHDSEARSKLQGKVNRIRHRITINVYDSARRRL